MKFKKYLGDRINEEGPSPSITETINKIEASLKSAIDNIIDKAEYIALRGMNNSMTAMIYFEAQVVTWIGITNENIQKLQDIKNRFICKVLEATKQGKPIGKIKLDMGML